MWKQGELNSYLSEPFSNLNCFYPEIFQIFAINNLTRELLFDKRVVNMNEEYLKEYRPVVKPGKTLKE